jgi:hypothetical protein
MNSNFGNIPLFVIKQNCDLVIDQICQQLYSAGFQTLPTFNLKTSLPDDKCCDYPPDRCECQVAILLVYGKDGLPFSLSLFGEGDKTTVALCDSHSDGAMITGLLAGKLDENVVQLP